MKDIERNKGVFQYIHYFKNWSEYNFANVSWYWVSSFVTALHAERTGDWKSRKCSSQQAYPHAKSNNAWFKVFEGLVFQDLAIGFAEVIQTRPLVESMQNKSKTRRCLTNLRNFKERLYPGTLLPQTTILLNFGLQLISENTTTWCLQLKIY